LDPIWPLNPVGELNVPTVTCQTCLSQTLSESLLSMERPLTSAESAKPEVQETLLHQVLGGHARDGAGVRSNLAEITLRLVPRHFF
jgi:hypothetical protein